MDCGGLDRRRRDTCVLVGEVAAMSYTEEDYAELLAKKALYRSIRFPGKQFPAKVSKPPTAPPPDPQSAIAALELAPCPDVKVRRRNNQYEFSEQVAYFDQVNAAVIGGQHGASMIYAVTNSNVAGVAIGKKLVKAGLRRGYPDINIDVPMTCGEVAYNGLRIEMKKSAGVPSDVSAEQKDWHDRLRQHGYKVAVCFGWSEAFAVTKNYLGWIK